MITHAHKLQVLIWHWSWTKREQESGRSFRFRSFWRQSQNVRKATQDGLLLLYIFPLCA